MTRKKSASEIPHIIFVYCGGHGATQTEKQIYLINSSDPGNAMFQIEFKLRYLVKDQFTTCRVFGVFDCCRVNLTNMPSLAMGRGVGNDGNDEYGDEEEDNACKYFHTPWGVVIIFFYRHLCTLTISSRLKRRLLGIMKGKASPKSKYRRQSSPFKIHKFPN